MLKVLLEMVELGFTGRFYNNKTWLSSLLGVCLSVSLDKFCKLIFTDKMIVISDLRTQKKDYRCSPTFVNLKSNTMKNTLQR